MKVPQIQSSIPKSAAGRPFSKSVITMVLVLTGLVGASGCVSVKTEHKIEPIHITMDVNVRLERELNDAFGDLDARTVEIAEQKGVN
jgi:hypothetical protein